MERHVPGLREVESLGGVVLKVLKILMHFKGKN